MSCFFMQEINLLTSTPSLMKSKEGTHVIENRIHCEGKLSTLTAKHIFLLYFSSISESKSNILEWNGISK